MPTAIPVLLGERVRDDPGRPAVTWLDPDTGARVELSRATLANWVAKVGGLLQDAADVESTEQVRLRLPSHWLAVVWPLACWSVGAVVLPDDSVGAADVEVTGDVGEPPPGGRVVVVGLAPLGGRSRRPVRPGVLDAGAEVLGQPDDLVVHDPPTAASAATVGRDHAGLIDDARSRAAELQLRAGARLATDVPPCSPTGLVETVLAPLVVGGSLVLLTRPDPVALRPEQPDALAGNLRG